MSKTLYEAFTGHPPLEPDPNPGAELVRLHGLIDELASQYETAERERLLVPSRTIAAQLRGLAQGKGG